MLNIAVWSAVQCVPHFMYLAGMIARTVVMFLLVAGVGRSHASPKAASGVVASAIPVEGSATLSAINTKAGKKKV